MNVEIQRERIPQSRRGTGSYELGGRHAQRAREAAEYTSVIVQRNAEARRHPDDILEMAIEEGESQVNRNGLSLGLSAASAGLILGFSAMAVGVVTAMAESGELGLPTRLAQAIFYPAGFVVCVMSGTELFTEHTATALYPALDRRASFLRVRRVWALVLLGNLIGTLIAATLLSVAEPVIGAKMGYAHIAAHLLHPPPGVLFVSAVLAGWLMAMGQWLILTTRSHPRGRDGEPRRRQRLRGPAQLRTHPPNTGVIDWFRRGRACTARATC